MKANRLILLAVSSLLLSACSVPFLGKKAGLQVTANPQATVFLDNKSLGQTPVYQEGLKPGTYEIKVTPSEPGLVAWEGRVTLNPGAITVVDRNLAADASKSRGYSLSFEPISDKNGAEVNLVSFPDTVSVMVDGAPAGFTPLKSDSVSAGPHTFTLTSPGYQDMVIKASVTLGHRLVINAQLGLQAVVPTPTPEATPSASVTPTPTSAVDITPLPKQATDAAVAKPYVEINSPVQKWARVRAEASTSSQELAKVNHGDKFPYLSTSGSWYEIEYQKGKKGFVSAQYAKLVQ